MKSKYCVFNVLIFLILYFSNFLFALTKSAIIVTTCPQLGDLSNICIIVETLKIIKITCKIDFKHAKTNKRFSIMFTVKTSQKNIHTQTNLVYEIRLFGLGG